MTDNLPRVHGDEPVAVIGLGLMGGAIARRLLATGQPVHGCDPRSEATAALAAVGGAGFSSAATAAEGLGRVVIVVHDEAQVDAVLFGPDGIVGTRPVDGRVVWVASTVSPEFIADLAARLERAGIGLIDGPVSGGIERAEHGELSVFVGAATAAATAMRDVQLRVATQIFPAGAPGAGSTMKLVNQILTAANIALTAEALAIGRRSGIDAGLLIDAITHSAGASRQFEVRAPRIAAGDHRPTATVRTFLKDLDIALAMADRLSLPAPMAAAARSVFARAGELGLLDASDTRIIETYDSGEAAT